MRKHRNLKQISEFCTANRLCRMSSDMQPIIDHIRNLSEIWPKFGRFALLLICLISTSVYIKHSGVLLHNYLLCLLYDQIDLTVEKLMKKPRILKIKRVQKCKTTTSMPPVDIQNWCLTDETLKRFNRSTNEIPTYNYNTDQDEENDEYHNDEYENKKEKIKKTKKAKKRSKKI
ncbi:hypothetical protein GLOIN_2v1884425 [Rhizophagus irregularis DAOM 181602=DAOM 197198]|nr:hypothetical protein GLOIN_2v1884425 [Rhizophagus irregularis DAOM 181602=DAOM 197198]